MEARELVSMGYMPKPRETLEDFVKSGEKWYTTTEKFKQDLLKELKKTLKAIRIYPHKNSLVQVLKNPKEVLKGVECMEDLEPKFPVISISNNGKTRHARLRQHFSPATHWSLNVKYGGVEFPIALMDTDYLTDTSDFHHELSHCIRNRVRAWRVKDAIFDEKIAYETGGADRIGYLTRLDSISKDYKKAAFVDLGLGAFLCFLCPLASIFPFAISGNFFIRSKTHKGFGRKLNQVVEGVESEVGRKETLMLAQRTSRKEFVKIHKRILSGSNIDKIISSKIKESSQKYRWRWEIIKENICSE